MQPRLSQLWNVLIATVLVVATVCMYGGCAHISLSGKGIGTFENDESQPENHLPSVEPPMNSVQVEVLFIERPTVDPLVNHTLWSDLAEITAVNQEARPKLRKQGFLVGQSGFSPPRSLQNLLGMYSREDTSVGQAGLKGRRLWFPPGKSFEIQASGTYDTLQANVERQGRMELQELKNARCVVRLTAVQLEDGWATLEFLPEIHHGDFQLRHEAAEGGWEMRTSQNIERYFDLRFHVTLNVGEMTVIGCDIEKPDTLASKFLVGPDNAAQMQRVLVVRLADVRTPNR